MNQNRTEGMVVIPKLPPSIGGDISWWTRVGPIGFTDHAVRLFERRRPQSTCLSGTDVPKRRRTDDEE